MINGAVDEIIAIVMKKLGLEIPEYNSEFDPTRNSDMTSSEMDWTIPTARVKEMKILYKKVCKPTQRKRKTFMYEREREFPKKVKKEKVPVPANQAVKIEMINRIPDSSSAMGNSGIGNDRRKIKQEKEEIIDETSQNSEIIDSNATHNGLNVSDSEQNLFNEEKASVI